MIKKTIVVGVLWISLFACEQRQESKPEENPEIETKAPVDSVKSQILVLNDSVSKKWNEMIAADDQKFNDIKRLLQEVSFTKKYNVLEQQALIAMADSVKSTRYTQANMTSEQIDAYDAATEKLVRRTMSLVSNTPEMKSHSITESLVNDILGAEAEVVNYRFRYDRWAKEFNGMYNQYKNYWQQFGEPYSSLSVKPLFELPV